MDAKTNGIDIEKQRRRSAKMLVWACFFVYVFAMGSKHVYTAEIVAIQGVFNKTKSEVSLAMTYFFFTYAIMQLLLAVIMKRVNLKIYLSVTASISAILTILIAFMPSIEALYVICAVNGIMQAGVYAGCMGILSKYLPKDLLPFGNKVMGLGAAFYGIIAYGVPAIFVSLGSWNLSFIVVGILFLVPIIFFFFCVNKMKKYPRIVYEQTEEKQNVVERQKEKPYFELKSKKSGVYYYISMVFVTLVTNCSLFAVWNWIPNMLYDIYSMPQSYSILITLLAPIVQGVGSFASVGLCQKHQNIFKIGLYWMIVCLLSILPLIFFYNANIVLLIVLLLIFIFTGQGARSVFGGVLAFNMRSRVNSGSFLALINAFASFAASFMPIIAGKIIESYEGVLGYGKLFLCTSIITAICVITISIVVIVAKHLNKKQVKEI